MTRDTARLPSSEISRLDSLLHRGPAAADADAELAAIMRILRARAVLVGVVDDGRKLETVRRGPDN